MKRGWHRVTWYSKLLTAGLLAGLYIFGVYVGQQYTETLQPTPAIIYTAYTSKEVPLLMAPIVFKVTATQNAAKKITAPATKTTTKTTTKTGSTSAATSSVAIIIPPVVTPPQPVVPLIITPTSTPTTTPPVVTPPPVVPPPPATTTASTTPTPPPVQNGNEIRFTGYTTGYGWPDNTPPGGEVSDPVLHQSAGGTGTYSDPITLAVGHTISSGKDTLDYPKGTKFYVPNLKRYFIVEDTCGDGNSPQNGPCHTGFQGHVWLDLWIGGQGAASSPVLSCEDTITGLFLVIQNPASNYAVISGPVYGSSCSAQFGDTAVSL